MFAYEDVGKLLVIFVSFWTWHYKVILVCVFHIECELFVLSLPTSDGLDILTPNVI